jgi:hypothetical protein
VASAFSITTTTNAITLDADRGAVVVFTVSNQLGRSARVRASVSPFAPTPPEWFRIDGDAERVFPPGGSEVFNVRIKAPPDAPPGQNAFRLDAVSADRPDDEWAHGPLVGFQIPTPPDIPEPPKPKVLTGYLEAVIGALAGALIAIVAMVIFEAIQFSLWKSDLQYLKWSFLYMTIDMPAAVAPLGAIGIVVALLIRRVPDPALWRTGLVFGLLVTVILTIIQVLSYNATQTAPDPIGPVAINIVGTLVAVVVVALIARAVGRFLGFGKL